MSAPQEHKETPLEVIHEFINGVDDGSIRRDLGEDCILSFYSRNVRGAKAVTGFLRNQLTTRYKHEGFEEAAQIEWGDELLLKARFGRSFDLERRRIYEEKERTGTTLHVHPESDDEEVNKEFSSTLITPPRPSSYNLNSLKYVEACGLLNKRNEHVYGGLDMGESCAVHLTLGYRSTLLPGGKVSGFEICLAVYDRGLKNLKRSTLTSPLCSFSFARRASARCNPTTDDEGDTEEDIPPPTARRCVRRTLFTEENTQKEEDPDSIPLEEQEQSAPQQQPAPQQQTALQQQAAPQQQTAPQQVEQTGEVVDLSTPLKTTNLCSYTSRKRQQTIHCNEVERKRATGPRRMRF